MSLNIRLKHSTTKDKKPDKSDLVAGELAININSDSPAGYALNTDSTPDVQQMFGKATESQVGQLKIATDSEAVDTNNNVTIITPEKLGVALAPVNTNISANGTLIATETAERKQAVTAEETARIAGDQQNTNALNTKVSKSGDKMTGGLEAPSIKADQIISPVVPVGWASCSQAGIDASILAGETAPYNIIDRVEQGSAGTFRVYFKTGEELSWNQMHVIATVFTTNDTQANASVHKEGNATTNTPYPSFMVKTVQLFDNKAPNPHTIIRQHVGFSVVIYKLNK